MFLVGTHFCENYGVTVELLPKGASRGFDVRNHFFQLAKQMNFEVNFDVNFEVNFAMNFDVKFEVNFAVIFPYTACL